ncbi:MAG: hypothetical protein AAB692_02665 [Patescibacteria group bacterium]
MAKKPLNLKLITMSVMAAVLILSAATLSLTSFFIWGALSRAAASPTGATAGRTETVDNAILDKTISAFKKKTSAPAISGDIRNPFAAKTVPPPPPTPPAAP